MSGREDVEIATRVRQIGAVLDDHSWFLLTQYKRTQERQPVPEEKARAEIPSREALEAMTLSERSHAVREFSAKYNAAGKAYRDVNTALLDGMTDQQIAFLVRNGETQDPLSIVSMSWDVACNLSERLSAARELLRADVLEINKRSLGPAEVAEWQRYGSDAVEGIVHGGFEHIVAVLTDKDDRDGWMEDVMDSIMQRRIIEVRNALLDQGWTWREGKPGDPLVSPTGEAEFDIDAIQAASGFNICGFTCLIRDSKHQQVFELPDRMNLSVEDLAAALTEADRARAEGMPDAAPAAGQSLASLDPPNF